MSEPKFTPGSWSVFSTTEQHGKVIEQSIAHGINIYRDGPEGMVGKVTTGNKADASLIAAAPDLYEALEAFVMHDFVSDPDMLLYHAEKALNKARGS
ncbi:hypothetical protein ACFVYJ_01360 [Pontibacter sp. JAM-7]|uniref:hypothetical protein n=1 Tax=Pontibacter sp. JAM-7 TaxID=3366581 RepID=UPI003AF9690A